jgi:hypothetical protein
MWMEMIRPSHPLSKAQGHVENSDVMVGKGRLRPQFLLNRHCGGKPSFLTVRAAFSTSLQSAKGLRPSVLISQHSSSIGSFKSELLLYQNDGAEFSY